MSHQEDDVLFFSFKLVRTLLRPVLRWASVPDLGQAHSSMPCSEGYVNCQKAQMDVWLMLITSAPALSASFFVVSGFFTIVVTAEIHRCLAI